MRRPSRRRQGGCFTDRDRLSRSTTWHSGGAKISRLYRTRMRIDGTAAVQNPAVGDQQARTVSAGGTAEFDQWRRCGSCCSSGAPVGIAVCARLHNKNRLGADGCDLDSVVRGSWDIDQTLHGVRQIKHAPPIHKF
jgi:hypothetical protein